MALFHLSVTQTKRSAGQSAIASAAYRAGERLYSEYYGEYSDYTRKGGVICSDILLPSHAPPEYADRQTLWNAVEKAERGKNAQLAYSFDIALQNEFSLEENIALARQFLLENFVSRGMVVDFAVQEIADALKGVDIPVLVKNPVNPDLELWIGALERINNAGLKRLGAIHRGFSSYDKKLYRNLPQWHIPIELRRRIPNLPIICDPSHIGGKRELVAPLCQQAMDLGFNGLIIESHCNPDCAWSDAAQQVTPDVLDYILNLLVIRKETQSTENLSELRKQIDECDNNLIQELAKRMRVAREIGTYKKEHDMTILQTGRYNEILEKRGSQGALCGMDAEFIKKVFEAIHEESVRQQMEIINK